MISTNDLQRQYVKIYKCLMHYIFDFSVVERLADFEVSVYKIFPDIDDIKKKFKSLRNELYYAGLDDDKELQKQIEKFDSIIEENDTIYYDVESFREVIDDENN